MADRNWIVFFVALFFWAGLFYAMDWMVMNSQGLPVGADLMPL